ncbi:MAG: hypothetical protein IKZ96_03860 [Bacilli bacterium]|nr:hypothetical protein [Bacilli bacterium]
MKNKEEKEQLIMQNIKSDYDLIRELDKLNIRLFYVKGALYVTRKNGEQAQCNTFGIKEGTISMISAKTNEFDLVINVVKRGSNYTFSSILFKTRDNKYQRIENEKLNSSKGLLESLKLKMKQKKDRQ